MVWANWLGHPRRRILDSNPFAGIPRRNTETDVRRQRRTLTVDEADLLIKTARNSTYCDDVSPSCMSACDPDRHKKAPPDAAGVKWRRRESNPNGNRRKCVGSEEVKNTDPALSGICQENGDGDWLDLASIDAELRAVIHSWSHLSIEVKQDILKLIGYDCCGC